MNNDIAQTDVAEYCILLFSRYFSWIVAGRMREKNLFGHFFLPGLRIRETIREISLRSFHFEHRGLEV